MKEVFHSWVKTSHVLFLSFMTKKINDALSQNFFNRSKYLQPKKGKKVKGAVKTQIINLNVRDEDDYLTLYPYKWRKKMH